MAIATTTLAIVGASLAIIGAGVGAYSSVQQAEASATAAKYNEAVAKNNAAMAHAQSKIDAGNARNRSRRLIAAQRTQFAKSGGSLSGSAIDVLYDTAIQSEQDALSIEYKGAVAGSNYSAEGRLQRMLATNASKSIGPMVAGSILSGAAGATTSYASIKGTKEPKIGGY